MSLGNPLAPHPEGEELKALVDGELDLAAAGPLRRHVASCAQCAEEVRIMRLIGEELSALGGAEAPAGLRGRVLASIPFASPRARFSLTGVWWADLVRVGALVGTATVVLFVVASVTLPGLEGFPWGIDGPPRMAKKEALPMAGSAAPESAAMERMKQRSETPGGAPISVTETRQAGGAAAGGTSAAVPRRSNPDDPLFDLMAPTPGSEAESARRAFADGDVKPASPLSRASGHRSEGSAKAPASVAVDDLNRYVRGKEGEEFRRKVVKTGELSVRVNRRAEEVQDQVATRVKKEGGYVEGANLTAPDAGERTVTMTVRVPEDRLEETVAWLSGLGEVKAKNLHSDDVSGQWIDRRSDLRTMRHEEQVLLKKIETAKKAWEREQAQWQLRALRPRIAAAEERFGLLSKLAALSTLHLTLIEEPQARVRGNLMHDMDNTVKSAVAAFMVALRVPATLLIWLAIFTPLWLPCVLVYRWATRAGRAASARRAVATTGAE
jgi:hypothetical protein